jgi:hypothetical protein
MGEGGLGICKSRMLRFILETNTHTYTITRRGDSEFFLSSLLAPIRVIR